MTGILQSLTGWRGALAAVVLAVAAGAMGVFTMAPLDRDESRYAQASAQMLETGDYVRIRFMDAARNKKPAGIHWLQAATVSAVSSPDARAIWAYRLPSLLGAGLAALGCFLAGRVLIGPRAALAGAAMFAVCLLMGTEAGIAKTDAALAGASTLMMAALARLRFAPLSMRAARWTAIGAWGAMGVAVLVKGPIAPLLAALTLGGFFLWERRAAWARPLLFWPGPLVFVLAVLPWFVAIELAGEGFLRDAIGVDFAPKMVSAAEGHAGPPGYHTLALLLQLWPATLFLVPGLVLAVRGARGFGASGGEESGAAVWRFLLCWAVPFLILYEIIPTKLSHYALPAYPAFALLASAGCIALLDGARMKWAEIASAALFILGAATWIAAIAVLSFLFGGDATRIAALAGGGVTLAMALAAALLRSREAGLALAVLAALVWHGAARGIVAPGLTPLTLSQRIAAAVPPEARPMTTGQYREPSLVFLLGGQVILVEPGTLEAAARAGLARSYAVPRPEAAAVEAALTQASGCARTLGAVSGLNYSDGEETDLVILAPCPGN